MKRVIKLLLIFSSLVISAPLWMTGVRNMEFTVRAQPSWARKYNVKCTLCHTTYPRLNRTGYEFKRLGYRLPREVEGMPSSAKQPADIHTDHKPYVIAPTGYKPKPATPESDRGRVIFEQLDCA